MKIIVTAGPTREYIDPVRFITNASSGTMGCAVAGAAAAAGHKVTLLAGPMSAPPPPGCQVVPFQTVAELKDALEARFAACDALVMAAAVGDFRPEKTLPTKLHRSGGPLVLRLFPTEDILAGLGKVKRPGQIIVAFAVEDTTPEKIEEKARREMALKNADFVVVNTPAAMAAADSNACILSPRATLVPWGHRPKDALAAEIVKLLGPAPTTPTRASAR